MKKLLYISFLALIAVFFIQCDSEDDLMTENALEGGLVDISSTSINYVVGSGATYTFDLFVHQEGAVKVNTINIYKSCFYAAAIPWSDPAAHDFDVEPLDSVAAKYTDEILEHTITITETSVSHSVATRDWTWEDLRAGLAQEDGNALPTIDAEMEIGNYFQFRVEAVLSDGRVVQMAVPVRMTVSTRYAGSYKLIRGDYWRIGVFRDDVVWEENFQIESIDAITYRMVGLAAWPDNELYFQIDAGLNITYPASWNGVDQKLNDGDLLTCEENASDLSHVFCGTSNYVTNDDIAGKDRLTMTFGYMTDGAREFYQILEKVPN